MAFIVTLVVVILVTMVTADVKELYLSDLCPRTPGGRGSFIFDSMEKSVTPAVVIRPTSQNYNMDTHCILDVGWPPEYHMAASIRRLQFRGNCVDNLTIYTDNQKHIYCGLYYDASERYSISVETTSSMVIEFKSGSISRGRSFGSIGFELTLTIYGDAPCRSEKLFTCANNRCIAKELNCSSHNHCGDNSNQLCSEPTPTPSSCGPKEFLCANGKCIHDFSVCDGYDNCEDLSDEINCIRTCSRDEFTCANGNCIFKQYVCNGENDCGDFSDEMKCDTCGPLEFTCTNGRCVSHVKVCDKENDCGDWSDEEGCPHVCWSSEFTCRKGYCIPRPKVCDKVNDCGDWSDEENCNRSRNLAIGLSVTAVLLMGIIVGVILYVRKRRNARY